MSVWTVSRQIIVDIRLESETEVSIITDFGESDVIVLKWLLLEPEYAGSNRIQCLRTSCQELNGDCRLCLYRLIEGWVDRIRDFTIL